MDTCVGVTLQLHLRDLRGIFVRGEKKTRSKHVSSVEYTEVSFSVKRKKTIEYLQSKKRQTF